MDSLKWFPAREPLSSIGLIVANDLSTIERLLLLDEDRLELLRGSFCKKSIILLGAEESLPWFPGAIYLWQVALASNILIPTNLRPNLPIDWVGRAITHQFGDGIHVIHPFVHEVYDVSNALKISKSKLRELLNEAS